MGLPTAPPPPPRWKRVTAILDLQNTVLHGTLWGLGRMARTVVEGHTQQ